MASPRKPRQVAVPVRGGLGHGRFYRVVARRVEYSEAYSRAGCYMVTADLFERRRYLGGLITLWIRSGACSSTVNDPLDVVVRAFLRTGHVPAEPIV